MAGKTLCVSIVSMVLSAGAWAGTEGGSSTFYGQGAGAASNPAAGSNTFVGLSAGAANTTGGSNAYFGSHAGSNLLSGSNNTLVGAAAGNGADHSSNNTIIGAFAGNFMSGQRNVFLGYGAGYTQAGSDRLVIDNCALSQFNSCDRPLISGDFVDRHLDFDGVLGITANRSTQAARSQLHFSVAGNDVGGWMTSAADNNFFTSSGARYDADAGGWIQRSADGKAVIAGSGGAGYRVLTSSATAVGAVANPVVRLHIDYDGLMGVNTAPVAGRAINTSTGAYLSSGGVWTNASSRALKADIERLDAGEAMRALAQLDPVRFRYKDEPGRHVGFIAEDVPELVATADRKGLSSMDVVAVLTKVVQRQDEELDRLKAQVRELAAELRRLR